MIQTKGWSEEATGHEESLAGAPSQEMGPKMVAPTLLQV